MAKTMQMASNGTAVIDFGFIKARPISLYFLANLYSPWNMDTEKGKLWLFHHVK